ncbi:MAG: tetratricopeptide repeat protein [Sulfuritalea sp.]|nr:tetratricopeptide repeat protein [Sulfuritalea sp.]
MSQQPQTPEAWAQEAATHLEGGRLDLAEECYRQVLELDPGHAEAHFKLGNIAVKRQLPADAEACYRRAVSADSCYFKAFYNLGNLLRLQTRLVEAEACYRRVIAIEPGYLNAHVNLGVTLKELGRPAEAETSYRSALQLQPDDAEVLNNLSVVLKDQYRHGEAEALCRRSLELMPRNAQACNNLGIILKEQGRLAEAEAAYRSALQLAPDYPEAYSNLGITLRALGRFEEALQAYRQAIRIRPDYANAYNNLGTVLAQLGRVGEAEELYRQVLKFEAGNAQTWNNLGGALVTQGRPNDAIASFREALRIDPDLLAAHSNLLFALNYRGGGSRTSLLDEARRYGQAVGRSVSSRFSAWSCPVPPERLRIGLVTADLRHHPVGFFLQGLLAQIDPYRFELIAYPTGHAEDALTARMRSHFSRWKPIADLDDEAAAHLIHSDGINILIDLSGHTSDNRLPVFGWRPAPVQVTWLGYFATTGVAEIDYLLATRMEVPNACRDQFTESIWYLPETRLCFTPPQAEIPVSGLPALRKGRVTFGSFQNLSKVGDEVLDTWARVLSALPTAGLRLQCPQLDELHVREQLTRRLRRAGIDPQRVALYGAVKREAYLAAHAEVDVILDTFPYPGGTTTCEALWMGVPTLTLAGETMLERQGANFLTIAGLPDWVAPNRSAYVDRALAIAGDLKGLADLRAKLRQQVLASPLFDAPLFARRLEAALEQMWQIWLSGHRTGNDA